MTIAFFRDVIEAIGVIGFVVMGILSLPKIFEVDIAKSKKEE